MIDGLDGFAVVGNAGSPVLRISEPVPGISSAAWAEHNIPEGLTVFGFPEASRQRLRTSNRCETLNSQIKRRTRVVGLFPNQSSLLRLVTGVVIEISEGWETGKIDLQPETKKQPI